MSVVEREAVWRLIKNMNTRAFMDYLEQCNTAAHPQDPDGCLRWKIRQLFLTQSHEIGALISPQLFPQMHPDEVLRLAEIAVQVTAGISEKYRLVICSNRVYGVKNTQRESVGSGSFHAFPKLPPELRAMIWCFAARAEDRIIMTKSLRTIRYAGCPTMFLVCKESKYIVGLHYVKIEGGNILHGRRLLATSTVRAPLVSFEFDVIMISGWQRWGNNWRAGTPIGQRRDDGRPVPGYVRDIAALKHVPICRVAVEQEFQQQMYEMLYYKNAYRIHTEFNTTANPQVVGRDDNAWFWTHRIQEVYLIDYEYRFGRVYNLDHSKKHHLTRVFPPLPGNSCPCILCVQADNFNVPYQKPAPNDREEHERIFNWIKPFRRWPQRIPLPEGFIRLKMNESIQYLAHYTKLYSGNEAAT